MARAWSRDLVRVGYKPPVVQEPDFKCEVGNMTFVPREMPTLMNKIGQKTLNVVKIVRNYSLTKERGMGREKSSFH